VTRKTNSRVAGFTFLAYIALGIPALILSGKATRGEGAAAQTHEPRSACRRHAPREPARSAQLLRRPDAGRDLVRHQRATRIPTSPCWDSPVA